MLNLVFDVHLFFGSHLFFGLKNGEDYYELPCKIQSFQLEKVMLNLVFGQKRHIFYFQNKLIPSDEPKLVHLDSLNDVDRVSVLKILGTVRIWRLCLPNLDLTGTARINFVPLLLGDGGCPKGNKTRYSEKETPGVAFLAASSFLSS